jgi:predicted Rossmann fold flavoprotein
MNKHLRRNPPPVSQTLKTPMHYDVIVIGGGASGMMAAGTAAMHGKKVLLLEKNQRLGEKLAISGGGRCNITNAEPDIHHFLSNYNSAKDFLYSSFAQFGTPQTHTFFNNQGLTLVTQARNRVFPTSQKAADVVKTLHQYLMKNQVQIHTACTSTKLNHQGNKIINVETTSGVFTATSYILATGGASHPEIGSTGDGFKWLSLLGHNVKNPTPTIVPIRVAEAWVKQLSGVSLPMAKITFYLDHKKQLSKTGPILFTHFGLSGPTILNSAGLIADMLQAGSVQASIDPFYQQDHGTLETQIIALFDQNKNKLLKSVFKDIAPAGTSTILQSLFPTINFETKVHSITKDQRKQLVHQLKNLPMTITGLMGFDRAVVADGGVPLTEIDTRTMQSKLMTNLYVTGDLLDINRPSGGFSLQLCWTTGFVAGQAAGK